LHDKHSQIHRADIHNIQINIPSSTTVAISENADCMGWKWKYGFRLKRFRR